MSYVDRESAPGPKRLLALDGGGMRGALTLEVLAALEAMLRRETGGDDSFVLGDWFDYIAGTSTGAIIAAALALGMPVLRNETTDSPWPLSNATGARFNDRGRPDCNLDLPLWQLVRGSTAAPIYFPAEVIHVGGRRLVFADGGLTSFNNPAFQLFLMATLTAYGLSWPAGVDSLLLVSVGTGYHPNADQNLKLSRLHMLHNVRSAPSALMFAALMQQDALCRVFGRCLVGGEIDSELGDLRAESSPGDRELFTYLRYNADLSAAGLAALGLGGLDSARLRRLDSVESIADLEAVGRMVVDRDLRAEHYRSFL